MRGAASFESSLLFSRVIVSFVFSLVSVLFAFAVFRQWRRHCLTVSHIPPRFLCPSTPSIPTSHIPHSLIHSHCQSLSFCSKRTRVVFSVTVKINDADAVQRWHRAMSTAIRAEGAVSQGGMMRDGGAASQQFAV